MPKPVDGVGQLLVDGEVVLLDGWRSATVVNSTGARIWECLDGRASIEQVCDRLASRYGAPVDVVFGDVLDFIRRVATIGLLDNVSLPNELQLTAQPLPVLASGDSIADVSLDRLDGTSHSFLHALDEPTLLVNWIPHCGYCVSIAERLAQVTPALDVAGVRLLLIAYGDAESNRSLAAQVELWAPILLRSEDEDPFLGAGTPGAVHVDQAGRIISDPVYGTEGVLSLAERLTGDEAISSNLGSESGECVRYPLDRGGLCAPGAGESSAISWVGARVYRIGAFHVGIRYDTDSTAAVSYTHLRAHETVLDLLCRLLLDKTTT